MFAGTRLGTPLLRGCTAEEKLAWIAERGNLSPFVSVMPHKHPRPPTYRFASLTGMECAFYFEGDKFIFLGHQSG